MNGNILKASACRERGTEATQEERMKAKELAHSNTMDEKCVCIKTVEKLCRKIVKLLNETNDCESFGIMPVKR